MELDPRPLGSWPQLKADAQLTEPPRHPVPFNFLLKGRLDMILELTRPGFKIPIISMLRALTENVNNIQELIDNVSGEIETLRKKIKENARSQKHY